MFVYLIIGCLYVLGGTGMKVLVQNDLWFNSMSKPEQRIFLIFWVPWLLFAGIMDYIRKIANM
jgi:hypothetical protein